jgi:TM2 domain-containing membrane protein YozV
MMAKKKKSELTQTLAIVALILNILVLPGLGTLIARKTRTGLWQLGLFVVGIPLVVLFGLGLLLMLGSWIWALVTGIQLVQESS